MRKNILLAPLAFLFAASSISAQEEAPSEYPSPNAIVDAAPASEWVPIAPSDLLVMDLEPDAQGNERRVIIQLMPPPFSQGWIRNIRKLAAAKFWDDTSINRVQDNYVVQWGDAGYDNPESGEVDQKALPDGLEVVPESAYISGGFVNSATHSNDVGEISKRQLTAFVNAMTIAGYDAAKMESEFSKPDSNTMSRIKEKIADRYSSMSFVSNGWPIAGHSSVSENIREFWPVHCYGMVGVGRNLSPDTGTGAELYTVIGHAPRHLDRNIALVGRIIEGMEHLSSLPRGKGQLGFYADPKKRVPIRSIRLGNELEEFPQPQFEYLDTGSKAFTQYAEARANRRDPFFIKPAGGADICNIPVPVRRVATD